jgi:hypothetical protein
MAYPFRCHVKKFRELGSRLDTFPISLAVTSSAAFPGVFHNVVLQNYEGHDRTHGRFGDAVLMDAGLVDNFVHDRNNPRAEISNMHA